jgi:hypothetical protein
VVAFVATNRHVRGRQPSTLRLRGPFLCSLLCCLRRTPPLIINKANVLEKRKEKKKLMICISDSMCYDIVLCCVVYVTVLVLPFLMLHYYMKERGELLLERGNFTSSRPWP